MGLAHSLHIKAPEQQCVREIAVECDTAECVMEMGLASFLRVKSAGPCASLKLARTAKRRQAARRVSLTSPGLGEQVERFLKDGTAGRIFVAAPPGSRGPLVSVQRFAA